MTRARGFTLIELLAVLTLSAVTMGFAAVTLAQYFSRSAARQAAQVFAQDLTQARQLAVRSQTPVVLRFFEGSLRYEVATLDGATELVQRRFSSSDGLELSEIALELAGDTVLFDRRGFADLSGASGTLGVARFVAGSTEYRVSFNALGSSRVQAP